MKHPLVAALVLPWWAAVAATIFNTGPLAAALVATVSLVAASLALSYLTESDATRAPETQLEPVDLDGAHPLTVGELATALDGLDVDVPVHLHVALGPEPGFGFRMSHVHVLALGEPANPSSLVLAAVAPRAHG